MLQSLASDVDPDEIINQLLLFYFKKFHCDTQNTSSDVGGKSCLK